jgi:DNA polymerase III delta prime subunit
MRETKTGSILLLVDTTKAGAGMDGIYSASREVDEANLFSDALRFAKSELTSQMSRKYRDFAERAVKKARGFGRRFSVSLWTEFDFICQVAAQRKHPGSFFYLLGMWPVLESGSDVNVADVDVSRIFVDRLLGAQVSGLTPARRIETLRLLSPSDQQVRDLEGFLRTAATKSLLPALAELADKPHLWVNALQVEGAAEVIQGIELSSWRTNTGRIAKWSGLVEESDSAEPPVLILNPDADKTGDYSKLEVKWKSRPENLEKGSVEYRISILTEMDEELASKEVQHSASREEKCRFSNDDFATLSEDALISAKVVLSVIGNDLIERCESEEFVVRFGQPPEREHGGVGKKIRTFSEGVIELDSLDAVSALSLSVESLPTDSKGFVLLRTPERGKSFRVFRPPLIEEIERQWVDRAGAIGRWRVKVRSSGARATEAEFVPLEKSASVSQALWDRVATANRRMSERFATWGGGVGQIYNQRSKDFDSVVKEYLLAWTAMIDEADPLLALANSVEVQSLSGRTIGLIVPPAHPLRVAWHVAYDNLVFHAAFEEKMAAKEIRDEFSTLDGAMFPAFLPRIEDESSFVFADTLGFHSVGMVLDSDKEPKAAVALLARALGESETADTIPTVGKQSATILGNEIIKYMECHNTSRLLHIHALRSGDGLTVARSLGRVHEQYRRGSDDDEPDEPHSRGGPAFVLELYPSEGQRGIAGRFIAEAREKRRSGAGVLSADDQWMLESLSLPGGVNLPRLRWARKSEPDPRSAAHLAVAFDTFDSRVVPDENSHRSRSRPLYAFGLLSFFERDYAGAPSPIWRSRIALSNDGEKHPADRAHTERLVRLQQAVQRAVARSIQAEGEVPILRTEISPEKAQTLRHLHQLCDWVITLDRNAGVEYFDSPKDNKEVYDAYVIDCVPERQDLGCLQLITSTSNLEEVRNLLDGALDQMGLSRSRRNAEFLMEHLKSLSGRLAIRLTGEKAPTSELIALALSHANCGRRSQGSECWMALDGGFIIPVDDVRDLLPPLKEQAADDEGHSRPDLIYVSVVPRKGLLFQFIEVKYRRHLSAARNPEVFLDARRQVESLRKRWEDWYCSEGGSLSSRAVRRAKLARMLRFYADKARRHYLPNDQYDVITSEIDRMIEKAGDYSFSRMQRADRGWVFCPEYAGSRPLEVSSPDWETRVFLFGPTLLPDSEFRRDDDTDGPFAGNGPSIEADALEADGAERDGSLQTAIVAADPPAIDATASQVETAKHRDSGAPSLRLGADVLTGSDVCWSLTIKGNPHLLIAGLPGMGKTTCLLNLCSQMLAEGVRPIVFSYHPDFDERLQLLVPSVRFVDFHGLGFNPLQVLDRESAMAYLDVAGALRDIVLAIFPELGDIQAERVRKAIKDSFIEAGWSAAGPSLSDLREPPFRRFVEILRNDPKPDRGLRTLLARLDELGDYGFFAEGESEESLWDSGQPIVIRIHTTQNENLQRAFASVVFYGLYKDMFRRGIKSRITHALVFDEAHRAAGLKLIPTMAKECRKFGISLVVASQEARDFNISLFSAIANYLVLRLTEVDAKALVRNVSSSQQERLLIDKIKQMDRFKALYFCEGKSRPSLVSLTP